jgi:CcmD family protein
MIFTSSTLVQESDSAGIATAYDSLWSTSDVPVASSTPFESMMLSHDKLFVVLAVVLIIWIGIVLLLLRTDRKLDRLERQLKERIPSGDAEE